MYLALGRGIMVHTPGKKLKKLQREAKMLPKNGKTALNGKSLRLLL
jgi:hypothetical protein